jgi:hypothetical protein
MGESTKIEYQIRSNVPLPVKLPKKEIKLLTEQKKDDTLSKGCIRYRVQIARYRRGERIL